MSVCLGIQCTQQSENIQVDIPSLSVSLKVSILTFCFHHQKVQVIFIAILVLEGKVQ